ncbi:MAG: hypothetical protein K2Y05_08555 [Hyphomicrobiaceae bacterium]|nr:hypothetical protein [Hyphomicrobiaceae bacterium]
MRIMKIQMSGTLRSLQPGVDLTLEPVRTQLYRDLEGLKLELAERVRAKAVHYLPAQYAVFVRIGFEPAANKTTATFWIDDPTVSGLAGLLARRAWKLSTPILAHVLREAVQERLQSFAVDVEEPRTRVESFAAVRGWFSPPVLIAMSIMLTTAYWAYGYAATRAILKQAGI